MHPGIGDLIGLSLLDYAPRCNDHIASCVHSAECGGSGFGVF